MNAEIVAGTITSKQDAMDYVTWTYFFRRLLMNPSYYQLEVATKDSVNGFLSQLVSGALAELEGSYCIEFEEVNEEGLKTVLYTLFFFLFLSFSRMIEPSTH